MLGATAQASDAMVKAANPASSGGRRPSRSLTGPNRSWPVAMPIRHAVRLSCTADALACRSRLISGSAGRYMSMHSGPTIVMEPIRATWRQPVGMPRTLPRPRARPGSSSSAVTPGPPATKPTRGSAMPPVVAAERLGARPRRPRARSTAESGAGGDRQPADSVRERSEVWAGRIMEGLLFTYSTTLRARTHSRSPPPERPDGLTRVTEVNAEPRSGAHRAGWITDFPPGRADRAAGRAGAVLTNRFSHDTGAAAAQRPRFRPISRFNRARQSPMRTAREDHRDRSRYPRHSRDGAAERRLGRGNRLLSGFRVRHPEVGHRGLLAADAAPAVLGSRSTPRPRDGAASSPRRTSIPSPGRSADSEPKPAGAVPGQRPSGAATS